MVVITGLFGSQRVFRAWTSKSLEAELLAEEELAKRGSENTACNRRSTVHSRQSSTTKERKIQRNRSRKERRRLVDGLESKDVHIELDDDSGSTQSSQSDSGGGVPIQPLEEESSWTPAMSKQAKKSLQQEKSMHQKRGKGAARGEREIKPAPQKKQAVAARGERDTGVKLNESRTKTAPGIRNIETSKQSKNEPNRTPQTAERAVRMPTKDLERSRGKVEGGRGNGFTGASAGATVQATQPDTRSVSKRSGRPSRDQPSRKAQATTSQRTKSATAAAPVVNAWKKNIVAAPEVPEVCIESFWISNLRHLTARKSFNTEAACVLLIAEHSSHAVAEFPRHDRRDHAKAHAFSGLCYAF